MCKCYNERRKRERKRNKENSTRSNKILTSAYIVLSLLLSILSLSKKTLLCGITEKQGPSFTEQQEEETLEKERESNKLLNSSFNSSTKIQILLPFITSISFFSLQFQLLVSLFRFNSSESWIVQFASLRACSIFNYYFCFLRVQRFFILLICFFLYVFKIELRLS